MGIITSHGAKVSYLESRCWWLRKVCSAGCRVMSQSRLLFVSNYLLIDLNRYIC